MRRIVVLAFALTGIVALVGPPAGAAQVDTHRLGKIVVLNGRTIVAEGDTASAVVVFHGRTIIDGRVEGSVVVFDGSVRISGSVRDNVVVFRGPVHVTSGARIGGDLVSHGVAKVDAGARIDGQRKRVSNLNFTTYSFLARFLVWLAYSVAILVLGLLMMWLVPGPLESVARASRSIGASIGWGFAMLFGLPIVTLLVAVTVVGLLLGLSLLMALWFLFTVGYALGVFVVGRMLIKPPRGRMPAFFAGFGILRAAALVPVLGGLSWMAAAILGMGAATIAVWRSHRTIRDDPVPAAPLAPAPPPPAAVH